MELNKLNCLLSLVREKEMTKTIGYVCDCERSIADDLITGYVSFGVKAAGTFFRVLNGTGEIDTALKNRKRKQLYKDSIKYRWQTKS